MFSYPLNPPSGHGIQPGVYQRHLPRLRNIIVNDHLIFLGKIKGNITAVQIIICKPFLDHLLLIPTANHKFMITIIGIQLHDMPQNRLISDLYHRLRSQMTFLTDSGSETTRQNNNFHMYLPRYFYPYILE